MSSNVFDLKENPTPIELREAGIVLIAPGLRGRGSYAGKRETGQTRALSGERDALDKAIAEAGLEDRHTLILEAPTPEPQLGSTTRAGGQAVAHDAIQLQVAGRPDEVQFAIYTDEAGIISFHYPQKTAADATGTRAFGSPLQYRYQIPLRKARGESTAGSRGLLGFIGSKIVKIVVGKLLGTQTGKLGHWAIQKWENSARAFQGLHGGADFSSLMQTEPQPFGAWNSIRGKKALLFVHGTSSSTAGAFAGLLEAGNRDVADTLYQRYGGRVLAFNHHTMSIGVADNVRQFYEAFQQHPGEYTFDIICHSRGGLVSRALTRLPDAFLAQRLDGWQRPAAVKIRIDRIVFVATPNGGTDLARPGNIPQALERLANYVNIFPDSLLTIGGGMLLSLAAGIAEAGLPHVPGLDDQQPDSELVKALTDSQAEAPRYFAFQANYEVSGKLREAIKASGTVLTGANRFVDGLFGESPNDLVVPTTGVADNRHFRLPETQVVKFQGDKVHHTNFFFQPDIRRLLDFLPG